MLDSSLLPTAPVCCVNTSVDPPHDVETSSDITKLPLDAGMTGKRAPSSNGVYKGHEKACSEILFHSIFPRTRVRAKVKPSDMDTKHKNSSGTGLPDRAAVAEHEFFDQVEHDAVGRCCHPLQSKPSRWSCRTLLG